MVLQDGGLLGALSRFSSGAPELSGDADALSYERHGVAVTEKDRDLLAETLLSVIDRIAALAFQSASEPNTGGRLVEVFDCVVRLTEEDAVLERLSEPRAVQEVITSCKKILAGRRRVNPCFQFEVMMDTLLLAQNLTHASIDSKRAFGQLLHLLLGVLLDKSEQSPVRRTAVEILTSLVEKCRPNKELLAGIILEGRLLSNLVNEIRLAGDYATQGSIIELLVRVSTKRGEIEEALRAAAAAAFQQPQVLKAWGDISTDQHLGFYKSVRIFLNELNASYGPERTVYSVSSPKVVCGSEHFESCWIDFGLSGFSINYLDNNNPARIDLMYHGVHRMSKSGNNISLQLTDSGYDGLLHDCRKTGLEATITFPIAPHASAGVKWASGQIVKSRDEQVAHKNQEDGPMFLPAEGSRVALPSEQDNRRKNVSEQSEKPHSEFTKVSRAVLRQGPKHRQALQFRQGTSGAVEKSVEVQEQGKLSSPVGDIAKEDHKSVGAQEQGEPPSPVNEIAKEQNPAPKTGAPPPMLPFSEGKLCSAVAPEPALEAEDSRSSRDASAVSGNAAAKAPRGSQPSALQSSAEAGVHQVDAGRGKPGVRLADIVTGEAKAAPLQSSEIASGEPRVPEPMPRGRKQTGRASSKIATNAGPGDASEGSSRAVESKKTTAIVAKVPGPKRKRPVQEQDVTPRKAAKPAKPAAVRVRTTESAPASGSLGTTKPPSLKLSSSKRDRDAAMLEEPSLPDWDDLEKTNGRTSTVETAPNLPEERLQERSGAGPRSKRMGAERSTVSFSSPVQVEEETERETADESLSDDGMERGATKDDSVGHILRVIQDAVAKAASKKHARIVTVTKQAEAQLSAVCASASDRTQKQRDVLASKYNAQQQRLSASFLAEIKSLQNDAGDFKRALLNRSKAQKQINTDIELLREEAINLSRAFDEVNERGRLELDAIATRILNMQQKKVQDVKKDKQLVSQISTFLSQMLS